MKQVFDRDNRNSSEELAEGAKAGARAARQAAGTIKHTAAAAGMAATGNVAGAAVELAKDKTWRMIALFLAIAILFPVFVAIFFVPMALYETLSWLIDEWNKLSEEWKVEFYSGTAGRFVSFWRATGAVIWNRIKGSSSDEGDTDVASDSDLEMMEDIASANNVYKRKIQAAKDKVSARQEQIVELIRNDANSGRIRSIMAGRYEAAYVANGYEHDIKYVEDSNNQIIESSVINVYDGTQIVANSRTFKDIEALQLLCLHTAQKNGDIANIKLSGFVKWLGYNGADNRTITFPLGENTGIEYTMKSWTGGFLPQYLEDEAAEQGKTADYESKYGAAITDMLIQVDCPNLYSIAPYVTEELKYDAKTATRQMPDLTKPIYGARPADIYPAYMRDKMPSDYYSYWIKHGYSYIQGVYCEGRRGNFLYARAGWRLTSQNGQMALVRTAANPKQPAPVERYEMKTIEYTYDVTYVHVKYVVPVTVSCRDIKNLLEMVGLWEGLLPEDLERLGLLDQEEGAA